jgi:cell wall-associated NlpC family hydrolase
MATHSAGALLDRPESAATARPAAELISSFGVALPTTSDSAPRHSAPVVPDAAATAQPGLVPAPRRSDDPTELLEGPPPAGLSRALPIPRRSGEFLSSATTRQGVVAAASVTVLGATAAIAAATGSTPAITETTTQFDALSHTAALPVQPATPMIPAPVAPLASSYDTAAKKVTDALPAALHRAEATQIIAASRAERSRPGAQAGSGARAGSGSGSGGGTAAPMTVAGSGKGVAALNAALTQRGKPYVWGAAGPSAFDCSGLVVWAFKQVGISLPHSSSAQSTMGTAVSRDQLQPGDLVFFYSPVSHVGIYAGNGQIVHASTSGQPVKLSSMSGMPFHNARRL